MTPERRAEEYICHLADDTHLCGRDRGHRPEEDRQDATRHLRNIPDRRLRGEERPLLLRLGLHLRVLPTAMVMEIPVEMTWRIFTLAVEACSVDEGGDRERRKVHMKVKGFFLGMGEDGETRLWQETRRM